MWRTPLPRLTVLLVALALPLPTMADAQLEPGEAWPGGDTSTTDHGRNAFSSPAANLDPDRQTPFFIGNSFFKKNWVAAPASTTSCSLD